MLQNSAQVVYQCLAPEDMVMLLQEVDYRLQGLRILVERCIALDIPRENYAELEREYLDANTEKTLAFNALLSELLPAEYLDAQRYIPQVYYSSCEIAITKRGDCGACHDGR